MPYQIMWEADGVYRRFGGALTIAERIASLEEICADYRFDSLRYAITDYLAVTDFETTPEGTAQIAALHVGPSLTNPRIVIAAVAVRPDVVDAIDGFKALGFTRQPYEVFADLASARAWVASVR